MFARYTTIVPFCMWPLWCIVALRRVRHRDGYGRLRLVVNAGSMFETKPVAVIRIQRQSVLWRIQKQSRKENHSRCMCMFMCCRECNTLLQVNCFMSKQLFCIKQSQPLFCIIFNYKNTVRMWISNLDHWATKTTLVHSSIYRDFCEPTSCWFRYDINCNMNGRIIFFLECRCSSIIFTTNKQTLYYYVMITCIRFYKNNS